jgi:putative lipoprotein
MAQRGMVLALALIVVATACDAAGSTPGGPDSPEPTPVADLSGSSWTVVAVGDAPLAVAEPPRVEFAAEGRIGGSTGCNTMTGSYAVDGASLSFGPLATTRRACEQQLMDLEAAVLEAFAGVAGWEIDGDGRLHLGGPTELVLEPAAP